MKSKLDESKPIFLQIKEELEDAIMSEAIKTDERVPSTNEFAHFYKINPATAAKGINELVAEGILYKRRGVGMFVSDKAREIITGKRKESFYENFVLPLKEEAAKLHIETIELVEMLKKGESRS
ncbi:GntR family transcriptional regulator [Virgibacillus halophilus]|uniref:GntR family transcriptional regulator n=1 Tax=Tigheibacillus halophilus TaxID=361280 RepID=A0ABU5C916_9BACI|nr:GntR family transcriptional regulator [Virgibacillus halophilus]